MTSQLYLRSALVMLTFGCSVLLVGCMGERDDDASESERVGETEQAVDELLIASDLNNKCLEIANTDPANGARVGMWDCHGGANQYWYWDGSQLRSRLNNKCLEIANTDPTNGARVGMWDCHGGANQHWYWDGRQLRSRLNNKCLEIANTDPANGARVGMWDCHGGANQHWHNR
jgi:hypothetical protein